MKKIAILGSTGSIGTQTLDIVQNNQDLAVVSLAAGSNIVLLEKQIRKFKPRLAAVWDEGRAKQLKINVNDLDIKIVSGMEGMIEAATIAEAGTVVTAVVGMIGILPTIAAIKSGKDIALANKETLVSAGHIIMPMAQEYNINILPVDSEHSAIFQSLNGENPEKIHQIILTASGGPFRLKAQEEFNNIEPSDALKHPNWVMGKKITIDSATMVNKGLEVIEAGWLFNVALDQIQVVVHPQSIIHSAVEYADGSIIAQLGVPDMRLPIQYALFYPERRNLNSERIDFFDLGSISFEKPRNEVFKGLPLAYQAGKAGGLMPTVYNAANEKAVAKFLDKKIKFLDIYEIIEFAMGETKNIHQPTVDEILDVERMTYELIESRW